MAWYWTIWIGVVVGMMAGPLLVDRWRRARVRRRLSAPPEHGRTRVVMDESAGFPPVRCGRHERRR